MKRYAGVFAIVMVLSAGICIWGSAYAQDLCTTKIAFVSYRGGNNEVYMMNTDGSSQVNLTGHPGEESRPTWSPDGTKIAFPSDRDDGKAEIYIMDLDCPGTDLIRLTINPSYFDQAPSWSPDGTQIAFASLHDGNWEIYVMDIDDPLNPTNLTNHSANDYGPSWSPDGTQIAFKSNRNGNDEIYVMDVDNPLNPTNLTNHPAVDHDPSWSPDGTKIAFRSNRYDGNNEIYVMNVSAPSDPTRLTHHPANDGEMSWSPDGAQIAFASKRDGNWEIYVMDEDGSNPANLTNNPADDVSPSWSRPSIPLRAAGAAPSAYLGVSVSLSGDYAIAGAYGIPSNAACIFEYNGMGWPQVKEITASAGPGGGFGKSVSISGDYAIVGAFKWNTAYVYYRNEGGPDNWGEQEILTGGGHFGEAVSISGDYAIVGEYPANKAYIFYLNDGNWEEVFVDSENGQFGISVSIDGDYAIVGAPEAAKAHIFYRNEENGWGEQKVLVGPAGSYFGHTASIRGDDAIVGAVFESQAGLVKAGAAYIFHRDKGGNDNWGQQARLHASNPAAEDYFGQFVAIEGDYVAVGAFGDDDKGDWAGAAYVFEKPEGGWSDATETVKLNCDPRAGDKFGISGFLGGGYVIVGAYEDDHSGGEGAGSAYVYRLDQAPIADAGPDQTFDCAPPTGVDVTLDGSGSSDPKCDQLTYTWEEGATELGTGETLTLTLVPGVHTITLTVDDGQGGSDDDEVVVTVSAGQSTTVAADSSPITEDEGQTAVNTGTVSGDAVTLSASVGTVTDNGDGTWSWSFPTCDGPAQSQTVTITAGGECGTAETSFELTVNNVAPTIDVITVPIDPVNINDQSVSASATFTDPAGTLDEPYTCTFDYGDGTGPEPGTVDGITCTGPDHTYAEAGVYTVTVTVTDKDGDSGSKTATEFIVIYDPDGGFVTGGGWIDSPEGAYIPDPTLTGKANFGFVSKYKKGAHVPTGQTQFQFKAGDLNFHSDSYEWLVVAHHKAMYKGVGTINGEGEYGFQLSAIDAALTPSTDVDLFRMRIWGDGLIYDNKVGETDDNADPTTALGGGNIKIHTKKKKLVSPMPTVYALLQNAPNPFNPETTIEYALPEASYVRVVIYNAMGQTVRTLMDGSQPAGYHRIIWDARDDQDRSVSGGIYLYRMTADGFTDTKRMILLR